MNQLEFLDGGMIYELNKVYNDLGQKALLENPELILDIYQSYLDLGCTYLTTCNYGYKSLKLDNWEFLVNRAVNIMNTVKDRNTGKKIKILGSLPPYFESYHSGTVDSKFSEFYRKLVKQMDTMVDYYILETQVSISHIEEILKIIKENSNRQSKSQVQKKIIVSIYPAGEVSYLELAHIIYLYSDLLEGIMVNCCSLEDVMMFFQTHIYPLKLPSLNVKFGFYCNKIDEKKYRDYEGNKKDSVKITDFYENKNLDFDKLDKFLQILYLEGYHVIVGGCCGYGKHEMKELIHQIKYLHVMGTSSNL